jgi:ketosteroid isomerase-like protein
MNTLNFSKMSFPVVCLIFLSFKPEAGKAQKNDNEMPALQVVKEFLDAAQHLDHKKAEALLNAEVEWSQPGNNRVSGTKKSSDEVFKMFGEMIRLSDHTLKLTDIKVLAVNNNSVACLVHWDSAQPPGGVLNVDNIDVYTVENGKIKKVTIYSADIEQENKFWGKD